MGWGRADGSLSDGRYVELLASELGRFRGGSGSASLGGPAGNGRTSVDQATRFQSELLTAVATSGKLRNSLG